MLFAYFLIYELFPLKDFVNFDLGQLIYRCLHGKAHVELMLVMLL